MNTFYKSYRRNAKAFLFSYPSTLQSLSSSFEEMVDGFVTGFFFAKLLQLS